MSSPSTTTTLIARIPYLNTEPFYHRFSAKGYELIDLPPRALGQAAADGRVAAGPMSVIDYLRLAADFEPLGPFGICTAGPVHSVLLLGTKSPAELEGGTIAYTGETSTSVVLLKMLFRHVYEVEPAVWRRLEEGEAAPAATDGRLLIGDAALREVARGEVPVQLDLGAAWWEWKRLPFVFALWVVRKDLPQEEKKVLAMRFEDAFFEGMTHLPEIAARRSQDLGMKPAAIEAYLRNFRYRLGPEERKGLDEFARLVREAEEARP